MTATVFIVGPRASGKTTIGRALARALGYDFVDTDRHLLESAGRTVAEIVAEEGWEGFRQRESAALRAVTRPATVVATGGGMVLAAANRQFMREHGIVLYLAAPAAVLAARLHADPETAQRPTLTGRPIAEEMAEVLAAREALYREVAHQVLDGTAEPQAVVEQALAALREMR
ncbi:shikimate kinase AroL [Desulfuromonas sp. CSMB_57]|jgi:shikimate kinase|uniref:shikimate kinase AroL n=1 Tax=Desulfuromonas sp. CSMB_57 TaxID=2807629 RepID=UPI0020BFB864|nr:shikimate kinase AroL [Desulfuromonas sp. CSMB_57]